MVYFFSFRELLLSKLLSYLIPLIFRSLDRHVIPLQAFVKQQNLFIMYYIWELQKLLSRQDTQRCHDNQRQRRDTYSTGLGD